MMVRKQILAIAMSAAVLGLWCVPAGAQERPAPFNPKATAISSADQAAMTRAAYEALERRVVGATATWTGPTNPKTKAKSASSGTIKVLQVYEEHGRPCAEIDNTYVLATAPAGSKPKHFVLEVCRLSNGLWRIGD